MFNRGSGSDFKPADAPKPAPMNVGSAAASPFAAVNLGQSNQAIEPSPAAYAPSAAGASVIGNDLTIIGQKIVIVSQGRIVVDGDVRGDVNGREVSVGRNGRVTGTIVADSIDIQGSVAGALKGRSISLQSTARVDGDILHETLAISEGASFDGRVRRPKDVSEITPVLDVAKLAV